MSCPSQYPSAMPDDASTFSGNIPRYKLFDPTSVGLAAFLGSPIAGTALMGINYRRLGKPGAASILSPNEKPAAWRVSVQFYTDSQ
jgi:hypothetical protein